MSRTYHAFMDITYGVADWGTEDSDYFFALVDDGYTFDPTHDMTDVTPHIINDLSLSWTPAIPIGEVAGVVAYGYWFELDLGYDKMPHEDPGPWEENYEGGFQNGPGGAFLPAGDIVQAVVWYATGAPGHPLLFLDEESFPELPAPTLGGEVDLRFGHADLGEIQPLLYGVAPAYPLSPSP